jgi:ADP-heptose:LPS heptosyltransferase
LIEGTGLVDEIVLFKAPWLMSRIDAVARAAALMAGLRGKGWDVVLVAHRSLGVRALVALSGIPRRVGFRWKGNAAFLTDPVDYDPVIHETGRHMSLLAPLGLKPASGGLAFPVSPRAKADADALLRASNLRTGEYAVLLPGGGRNPGMVVDHKRWSLDGYKTLARHLVGKSLRVLFLGDKADQAVCAEVAGTAGGAGVDLCGRTSEALGVPTLGFYGPSSPQHYGPLTPGHAVLYAGIECSPCLNPADGLSATCRRCPKNRCMDAVSTGDALRALDSLLEGRTAGAAPGPGDAN